MLESKLLMTFVTRNDFLNYSVHSDNKVTSKNKY